VVINALDALEGMPRGTVTISTAVDRAAGMARITVADDGPGMTPETLAGIFNLFMSTKGARGTGLGLTVSRKILREHGGDIRVMSDVGRGSTFTLEWPLRLPVEPPAAGAAAGTPAAAVP
jgi:signal transduction histidine kinase